MAGRHRCEGPARRSLYDERAVVHQLLELVDSAWRVLGVWTVPDRGTGALYFGDASSSVILWKAHPMFR